MEDQDGDWIKNARQEGFSNDGNQFDPTNAFAFDYPLQFDNSMVPREFATSNTIFNTATLPDDFLQFINEQQQQPLSTYEQGSLLPSNTVSKTPETGTPQLGQKRSREDSATDDAAKENDDEPSNQTMYILIVGGRTFRVSWESLKSDGPDNFFTMFFRKRKSTRLMHIDRDPDTFALVVHHLRGYYVQPRDDVQNQALLNDAQYYGLKRLRKILEEYLFLNVGGRIFRLPWSLLKKDGGSRNFFTGPVMHNVFSPHGHPSPIYIDRDPNTFADIISHLRGYTIHIRDEVHRKNLLKDAQYYALKQLRDKLMTSRRTLDGFGDRGHPEVLLLLQDVRPINLLPPREPIQYKDIMTCHEWSMSQLRYKRDDTPHALLVQISDFVLQAHNAGCTLTLTAEFAETQRAKLRDIAKETNASTEVDSRAYLDEACAMTVDDRQVRHLDTFEMDLWEQCRCHTEGCCKVLKLGVQRAIAGVHIIDNKVALCIVRFVAISSRFQLNMKREFLPEG